MDSCLLTVLGRSLFSGGQSLRFSGGTKTSLKTLRLFLECGKWLPVDRVLERLAVSPHCARVVTPVILLLTVVVHETQQRFIRLFADKHS
jgi:hypothetical protein